MEKLEIEMNIEDQYWYIIIPLSKTVLPLGMMVWSLT